VTGRPAGTLDCGGIIAAGDGSRLRADGLRVSKPMTPVGGRPLIEHALERFRAVGISRPSVILNEDNRDCRDWLEQRDGGLGVDLIVRTTPSSYASFKVIAGRLAGRRAIITTVDGIMDVDDFRRFVAAAAGFPDEAVVLGVSGQVDDENPLWATLDPADGRITEIGGARGSHATAGIYVVPARGIAQPETEFPRLRHYLGWLVDQGHPVYGVVVPNVFDIDRARDIAAAEQAHFSARSRSAGA